MKVLSQKEYSDIITWLPDGKSFTIVRPKAFVAEILPSHFKQAKYSSFTRKLHRWGFQRHLRGEEAGAFFHKLFQRGRLDLVEKMTCYKPETRPPMMAARSPTASMRDPLMSRPMGRAAMAQQSQMAQGSIESHLMQDQMRSQLQQAPQQTKQQMDPLNSVDRLNAAIELEVSRRLKERITAAALSRHALAALQQPPVPQVDAGGLNSSLNSGLNNRLNTMGNNPLNGGLGTVGNNTLGNNALNNMNNNTIGNNPLNSGLGNVGNNALGNNPLNNNALGNWNANAGGGAQSNMPLGLNLLNVGKGLDSPSSINPPVLQDFSSLGLIDLSQRNIQGAKTA